MIGQKDYMQLTQHFPGVDWDNLFWGFTCYSRQDYANVTLQDAEDEIMLGIQHPDGGCLCELKISWHRLGGKLVPQLNVFSEAWHLLNTPTFQKVLNQLAREKESLASPNEVSALLIQCGFTDLSDWPLALAD